MKRPIKTDHVAQLRGRRLRRKLDPQVQFLELILIDRRWRFGHQVRTVLRFGESDHVADVGSTHKLHHGPVEAEGEPAVRRRTELERIKQEAELGLGFFFVDAKEFEDLSTAPQADGYGSTRRPSRCR